MAIYHLSVQTISRDQGRSCVAAAAYRSGEKLHDERQDLYHDYTKKKGVESEIIVPLDTPSWVNDREKLWNEVDKAETRCNSRTAREINIALPLELSKEQQKEMVRDYVKKGFVDQGMVADVCFHFNDENNPHCHVMLTTREIDHEGFTKKNREWDKKDKVKEWRKEWEAMTNNALKSNGINERITCESHVNLGNEKSPTIHEGYVARDMERNGKESERINRNKLIKDYNNTVGDLRNFKEEKQENEDHKKFYRAISPDEKKILKNAAKELKLYINYDNVNNRLEQLKRWQKSLSFQPESLDKTKKLNRIGKEEELLFAVSTILETESNRFIKKNYINLDIDSLTIDEKIQIVNDTINNKKLLNADELELVKGKVEEDNLRKSLNDILKNNSRFTMSVQSDIEHIMKTFNELVAKYNIDFEKPETAKNAPVKIMADMKRMWNRQKDLTKALKIIESIYDIKLKEMYPTWQGRLALKLEEKELLILSEEYFGKTLMPKDFADIPYKYTSIQQEEILNILDIRNNTLLKGKYPDFKINEAYKNMFYMECYSNTNLTKASKNLVEHYFNKDNFMKNYRVFETTNTDFVSSNKGKSLLFEVIENVINEIDTRVKEDKFEKDRLKKKSQKLKQKRQSQDLDL